MSEISLTLVLQIKTSKIINDMAKVQQKSEKISAFGGIFFILDKFDRILSSVIDSHLGLRSKLIGYQYSEIIRAVFSVFCCGGDCMEDLNLYLKDVLTERPHTRVPSADTVLRGIEELATENISYTAAAQAEGRAAWPLRRRVYIPLHTDQRLGHDRRGNHTVLQQAGLGRTGL